MSGSSPQLASSHELPTRGIKTHKPTPAHLDQTGDTQLTLMGPLEATPLNQGILGGMSRNRKQRQNRRQAPSMLNITNTLMQKYAGIKQNHPTIRSKSRRKQNNQRGPPPSHHNCCYGSLLPLLQSAKRDKGSVRIRVKTRTLREL